MRYVCYVFNNLIDVVGHAYGHSAPALRRPHWAKRPRHLQLSRRRVSSHALASLWSHGLRPTYQRVSRSRDTVTRNLHPPTLLAVPPLPDLSDAHSAVSVSFHGVPQGAPSTRSTGNSSAAPAVHFRTQLLVCFTPPPRLCIIPRSPLGVRTRPKTTPLLRCAPSSPTSPRKGFPATGLGPAEEAKSGVPRRGWRR